MNQNTKRRWLAALLGAAALGDIGKLFPDTDDSYRGADSIGLLKIVMAQLRERGYALCNADLTIVAQRPKLRPYIDGMRAQMKQLANLSVFGKFLGMLTDSRSFLSNQLRDS